MTSALLAGVPRVDLGVRETPIERWNVGGVSLLIKRDDLSASRLGGNKVRALQFLLAGVTPGRRVLTVGSTGSTHALAVAEYGALLGAETDVITWPQETHTIARATADRLATIATVTPARSPATAFLRAAMRRMRARPTWIPAGGSSPLGALGHVEAALELVSQLRRDGIAMPSAIVVPLGTGGTVAGLLVGLRAAGVSMTVVAVRVVPSIVGNSRHVLRLARRTRRLVMQLTGERIPEVDGSRLEMDPAGYGGAYARVTPEGTSAAALLRDAGGPRLDGTYSAKAFARALERVRGKPDESLLFWLTFDGRWLGESDAEPNDVR
jgi:D-cysteine desulfhydrase